MIKRRSKMVSFRVSPDEYHRLREACLALGIGSVSEMARAGVQHIAAKHVPAGRMDAQIHDLRERVRALTDEINRLAEVSE
ncbi:MAG TPA: hypothetical protein VM120_24080 [Bryobacteraceae bacterium]|nr:hypothetical protein [Bryobacteraceae bacterium]